MNTLLLRSFMVFAILLMLHSTRGQVGINNDASAPDPSAMLDVKSTSKGLLIPRMSNQQMQDLWEPAYGLMVLSTDEHLIYVNKGTPASPSWAVLSSQWEQTGNDIFFDQGKVGINVSSLTANFQLFVNGGGTNEAIFGMYDSDHYGVVGASQYGIYGLNFSSFNNHAGVCGYNHTSLGTSGVLGSNGSEIPGYSTAMVESAHGVQGFVSRGYAHHYGVFGSRNDDNTGPSAGVIGTVAYDYGNKPWGALGFQDATLNEFAGYFSGNINITGGLKDGTGFGSSGCVLMSNGSNDIYWSTATGITGAGTSGYLPKWAGGTSLGNSLIYDGSSFIAIGTTTPCGLLTVDADIDQTSVCGRYNSDIVGYLGSASYGVAGYLNSNTFGILGGIGLGAYGQYNQNIYGSLGTNSYGVEGYRYTPGMAGAYFFHGATEIPGVASQWAADAYILNHINNAGSSYAFNQNNSGGLRAAVYNGSQYSFGVAGYNYNDQNRCSGVLGSNWSAGYWGALAYRNSSNINYGGYFTSYTSGSGKSAQSGNSTGIGIGAWGDLMGADIHGGVYGLYVEGKHFSIYSKGPVVTDQPVIQLQDVGERQKAATYTTASTEAVITIAGQGMLVNGSGQVIFDEDFRKLVSAQHPVIVTVTPSGPSNGFYIASADAAGFSVKENNDGSSNVQFYYMATGRRAGFEKSSLPAEVLNQEFEEILSEGLHNDADQQTSGQGMYFDGSGLRQGQSPEMINQGNKVPQNDKPKSAIFNNLNN